MTRTPLARSLRFCAALTGLVLACGALGALTGCAFTIGESALHESSDSCLAENTQSSSGALHCFFGELRVCRDGSWEKAEPAQRCEASAG